MQRLYLWKQVLRGFKYVKILKELNLYNHINLELYCGRGLHPTSLPIEKPSRADAPDGLVEWNCDRCLKFVAQRELHYAWIREQPCVVSERSGIQIRVDALDVEPF